MTSELEGWNQLQKNLPHDIETPILESLYQITFSSELRLLRRIT